eukprot:263448-Ditylum_brightwellii.AAC.1
MAQNSGSSLHGTLPTSTQGQRQLTHQGNPISKILRLSGTPRHITAQIDDDVSNLETSTVHNNDSSPTTQQGNQNNNEEEEKTSTIHHQVPVMNKLKKTT